MQTFTINRPLNFAQKSKSFSLSEKIREQAEMESTVDWAQREEARPLLKVEKSKVKFTKALRTAMSYDVIKGVQSLMP